MINVLAYWNSDQQSQITWLSVYPQKAKSAKKFRGDEVKSSNK